MPLGLRALRNFASPPLSPFLLHSFLSSFLLSPMPKDQKIYEIEWQAAAEVEESADAPEERWLVLYHKASQGCLT